MSATAKRRQHSVVVQCRTAARLTSTTNRLRVLVANHRGPNVGCHRHGIIVDARIAQLQQQTKGELSCSCVYRHSYPAAGRSAQGYVQTLPAYKHTKCKVEHEGNINVQSFAERDACN